MRIPAGKSPGNPTPRARAGLDPPQGPQDLWDHRVPGGLQQPRPPALRALPPTAGSPGGGVPALRWALPPPCPAGGQGQRQRAPVDAAADGDQPALVTAASPAGAAQAAGTEELPFSPLQLFGIFSPNPAQRQPSAVTRGTYHKDPPRPPAEGAEFGLGTAGNFRRGRDGWTPSPGRVPVCRRGRDTHDPSRLVAPMAALAPSPAPRRGTGQCWEPENSEGAARRAHPPCRWDGVGSNS